AYDHAIRTSVGGWLEAAGYDVILCTGPTDPDYRCVAEVNGVCPLADAADLIVLDAWLQSDADDRGPGAPDLVRFYRSKDRPLIVLDHGRSGPSLIVPERTALLEWPPNRRELEHVAQALLATPGQASSRDYAAG
ncbi:MAG TPA: hypothetical protein VFQ40_08205, partial [Actinomycetota bacterium]|nr:hypothetical protein [Actinomycetota bacterium]